MDIGPAVHQNAGLAKYANRLATTLLANHRQEIDLTLFYNAHSNHHLPDSLHAAPHKTLAMGQYPWRLSVLASQLLHINYTPLTPHPSPLIYHATEHLLPRFPYPTVLTVHDLIFERYPQHHTLTNRLFLKVGMPLFVKAATAIIAVSQQTKRDLIELYHTPADKIHVVYEGIDEHFRPASQDEIVRVKTKYSPERPYLLMVGTLEPRKNHTTALRALAHLKQQGFPHRLLVVGGHGWLFEPIRQLVDQLNLSNDVTFTGYIPLADLPSLYSGSDCVLLPSLYEGFGFPVLEAMACGAPVVCSNVSSLPEVAGNAALLVAPEDEWALTTMIQRLLSEPGLAEQMKEEGLRQAASFTWEKCAEETVALYRLAVQ
ncbi:MAG: glycosyltransferase family 1 protein [Caldilineaceae bacterium]